MDVDRGGLRRIIIFYTRETFYIVELKNLNVHEGEIQFSLIFFNLLVLEKAYSTFFNIHLKKPRSIICKSLWID